MSGPQSHRLAVRVIAPGERYMMLAHPDQLAWLSDSTKGLVVLVPLLNTTSTQ